MTSCSECAHQPARPFFRFLLLLGAMVFPGGADAHYDPSENIAHLNARIGSGSLDPSLYYDRGVQWAVLAHYPEAIADFNKALEVDEEFVPACNELAEVLALHGRLDEGLDVAQRGVRLGSGKTPYLHARCLAVLAKVQLSRNAFSEALAAMNAALKLHPAGEIEWYLVQATAHQRLGKQAEAIKDLKRGFDRSRSGVLRNAWLDALLDAGRGVEALPVIEAEVAVRPLKSSWLIRRARVRISLQQPEPAREDLRAALTELQGRIASQDPDVRLLADRGMASLLLGDKQQAIDDLRLAKEKGVAPDLLTPLENLLAKEAPVAETAPESRHR